MRRPRHHRPLQHLSFVLSLVLLLSRHAAADLPSASYSDQVCKPQLPPSEPLPPCVEIENIETLCYPNGTTQIYLEAHAQCMCRGSYFPEWNACRECLFLHGQLSERDLAFYQSIATTASSRLCGFLTTTARAAAAAPSAGSGSASANTTALAPPPTAIFKDLFTSVEEALSFPTTGATVAVDVAHGNSDVALYFTAPPGAVLGPGSITGSAASATATGLEVAPGRPSLGGMVTTTSGGLVGVSPPRPTSGGAAGLGNSVSSEGAAGRRGGRIGGWGMVAVVAGLVLGSWVW